MCNKKMNLLPIGTRVLYRGKDSYQCVKGTIVAYDGKGDRGYLDGESDDADLKHTLKRRSCDSVDCEWQGISIDRPYIVRLDPVPNCAGVVEYQDGYLGAYYAEDIEPLLFEANIFPNRNVRIMARQWPKSNGSRTQIKTWSNWAPMTDEDYLRVKGNHAYEFCIRDVKTTDEVPMIPLWRSYTRNDCDLSGYWPPLYAPVDFHLRDGSFHTGVTAKVSIEEEHGFIRIICPVFVEAKDESTHVYTLE